MKPTHSSPAFVFAVILTAAAIANAANWPAYRHDLARSGVTDEQLQTPLHLQWVHASKPPRPAWPEPGREVNRLAFDYAYDVAVADGLLYFGSSADHKVHCLDASTGQEKWSFFTEGPIRFAPAIEDGRVFVASDDGYLYCLAAADGKLLWKFLGGPKVERIMGNQQMMSRWPLRSGVGVESGIVYVTAGMWPTEGVYLYALRAADGSVVWKSETVGAEYRRQPHPGSFSMLGVAPQGYVLGNGKQLFIPTGRNAAAAYDRKTGKELYYHSAPYGWGDRWGGTWNFAAEGLMFGWRTHVGPDIPVEEGEHQPEPLDGLIAFDATTSKVKRDFPGGKLYAVVRDGTLYACGRDKASAYDLGAWSKGSSNAKWEADFGRAYCVISAGEALFLGGADRVAALGCAKGETLWQAPTSAQARSLAVSDGRLFVSTSDGRIACYGAQKVAQPPVIQQQPNDQRLASNTRAATLAQRILSQTGKREGLGLVLGAEEGALLYHLAKQSDLTLYCVEPDATRVAAVRQTLDAAGLQGDRVSIHQGPLNQLTEPEYFADLVTLGMGPSSRLADCDPKELYRVLRPHGGTAHVFTRSLDGGAAAIKRWLTQGGVPEGEIQTADTAVRVVRAPLTGSGNWTHQYASAAKTGCSTDEVVKLPLKLLWFGKPGPARMVSRHWGGPAPLCVDGRMYVIGQFSITAVDAYNGRELWRFDHDTAVGRWPIRAKGASVAAEGDSVFAAIGDQCLRLDAKTGKLVQTYQMPVPPTDVPANAVAKWTYLAVAGNCLLGSMGGDQQARAVFVVGKDGKPWWTHTARGMVSVNAVSMDDKHVYLIERPDAVAADRAKRRGETIPTKPILTALDLVTGEIAWETTEGIGGRSELWLAEGVLVASSGGGLTGYDAETGKQLYTRNANLRRFPVIVRDTIIGEPVAWDLHTGQPKNRVSPFTQQPLSWNFLRSYGCGSIAAGPNLLMFRSGTLGFYDLAGDSGVHNFAGIRAGCYVNAIAANGLVLVPPGDAGCTCSYNYRTTVALMPTTKHEQWSIFYDRLPTTTVNRAALNLGAPGDHRDEDGGMWIGAPRPETRTHRVDFAMPFRFDFYEGGGAYHYSADHTKIEGTNRPWIYTNGLRGLKRAEFDLDILDRGVTSWPVSQAPKIDGQTDDACWDGYRSLSVPAERASVTLRHDADNLYVAYQSPPRTDAAGKVRPWKSTKQGNDAKIWEDDSFELFLSGVPIKTADNLGRKCVHLGVSASGARYDALWEWQQPVLPTVDVPRVDVAIDGDATDWGDEGFQVKSLPALQAKMRAPNDFDQSFRLGWNDAGLILLAEIKDNRVVEGSAKDRLWQGDSLEIFMTPALGTGDTYQCVVAPGVDAKYPEPRSYFYDSRKAVAGAKLSVEVAGEKTADGYVMEVLLPWGNLSLAPREGLECGLQLFANDQDNARLQGPPFRVMWHPGEHPISKNDPWVYQTLRLATEPSAPIEFKRSAKPGGDKLFVAAPPLPFPLTIPALGAKTEDPEVDLQWASGVRTEGDTFQAEVAIPWKALEAIGLARPELVLDWNSRGPLNRRPTNRAGYERVLLVAEEKAKPRKLTVRLHFAEVENAKPGQRVFDVKLQGKTVLSDFDVAKAAGGANRTVVKEFANVTASRALVVELVPKAAQPSDSTMPIVSAVEIES